MTQRYDVQPFSRDLVDAAAELRAADHRRHRRANPALDPAYEDPAAVRDHIAALVDQGADGVFVSTDGVAAAYVIAIEREPTWGRNAWVVDVGSAGDDPEAIREGYARAAQLWVDAGRTSHYVIVNAVDSPVVDAWFRLSFGLQHVHAVRPRVSASFRPRSRDGLTIRRVERRDLPQVAELGLVLPHHVRGSPVFSPVPIGTVEEILAEAEEEFGDPRFTEFVAVQRGRVIGIAVACSIRESPGSTPLMRPASAGFLGHAAVGTDARGFGIGRSLGETVMAWARDEGYEWVAADWRSTNLEADRTWRALGFEPSFYRLHRLIG